MRHLLSAAGLLLAIGLTGCPGQPETQPDGTYLYEASDIEFPGFVAGFRRLRVTPYDAAGQDVGVGYRKTGKVRIEATVYVYPPLLDTDGSSVSIADQFDEEMAAVLGEHQGAREVHRAQPVARFRGAECEGRAAELELRTAWDSPFAHRDLASFITVFDIGPRRLKYRLTAPRESRDEAVTAFRAFTHAMELPPPGFRSDGE